MEKEEDRVKVLPAGTARGVRRRRRAGPARVSEGRVPAFSREPAALDRPDHWTFELVQERMVEAVRYWWRHVRDGGSPFATDGPWHLVVPEWQDWGAHDRAGERPRLLPLSREQIARMHEATEWTLWVAEKDRRLVALALRQLAAGRSRVSWRRLLRPMGVKRGADGLRMRYGRSLLRICEQLNSAKPQKCVVERVNP